MKIHILEISVIFLLFSIYSFAQTTNYKKNEKVIIGTWKIDSIEMKMESLPKEYISILNEKMAEAKKVTVYKFYKDKKYYNTTPKEKKEGKWNLSADGDTLKIFIDKKEILSKIILLTEKNLVLEPIEKSSSGKLFLYKEANL